MGQNYNFSAKNFFVQKCCFLLILLLLGYCQGYRFKNFSDKMGIIETFSAYPLSPMQSDYYRSKRLIFLQKFLNRKNRQYSSKMILNKSTFKIGKLDLHSQKQKPSNLHRNRIPMQDPLPSISSQPFKKKKSHKKTIETRNSINN